MTNTASDGVPRRCPQEGIMMPEGAIIVGTSPKPVRGISPEHRQLVRPWEAPTKDTGSCTSQTSTVDHQPPARNAQATTPHTVMYAPCQPRVVQICTPQAADDPEPPPRHPSLQQIVPGAQPLNQPHHRVAADPQHAAGGATSQPPAESRRRRRTSPPKQARRPLEPARTRSSPPRPRPGLHDRARA
jgi:hypothetical protein